MKPKNKLALIAGTIIGLNFSLGFDLRFTVINIIWCVPILIDFFNERNK